MYSILAFLLFLNVVLAAENNCDCSEATFEEAILETNDIVEFLVRVSKNATTEEEKYPAVPPGVVTGSLGCPCEELQRRKRKIMPNEEIPLIDKPATTQKTPEVPAIPAKRVSNRNCPVGYLRVAKSCIPANDMLY